MKTGWKQKKICFVLLFGILAFLYRDELLKAASGSIVLTTKEASVDQGEKVHVIISVQADSDIGDFEAYVKYDKSYLKFIKGGSYIQEEDNLLKISHIGDTQGETSRKYAMEFTALKRGKSKISLKENISLTELDSGNAMSLSTNDVTITIAKPVSPSSAPESTPSPTKRANEEQQTASPEPSEKATEEPEGITVNFVKKDSALTLKGKYEFKIVEVKKEQFIPEGYSPTKIKLDGTSITAYHNPKEDSDFVLLYLQNAEDDFGYYRYDTKEKTLQRYQREVIDAKTSTWSPDQVMLDHYRQKVKNQYYIIAVFSILLVILTFLLVWVLSKKQRR